jgi:hypothetical protein
MTKKNKRLHRLLQGRCLIDDRGSYSCVRMCRFIYVLTAVFKNELLYGPLYFEYDVFV